MKFDWTWLLRIAVMVITWLLEQLETGKTLTVANADGSKYTVSKKPGEGIMTTVCSADGKTQTFGGGKLA